MPARAPLLHMYSRFLVPLLVVAAIASAWGPASHSREIPAEPLATASAPSASTAIRRADDTSRTAVRGEVEVRVDGAVEIALRVTNRSDRRIELQFPSGQTHEVVIYDALGRPVWRWSEGRLFTQTIQARLLDAGETITYAERWVAPELPAGTYTAVATLNSTTHPLEERAGFTIP